MTPLRDTPRLAPVKPETKDRLESWKEIAAYLNRDERTVRRWEEAEALPVHRLRHGRSGSIYAFRSELNDWAVQRSLVPARPQQRKHKNWGYLGLAAVVLFVIATTWFVISNKAPAPNRPLASPFTGHAGEEFEPALSQDAKQVAYTWNGEGGENFDIYVQLVGGGPPLRLTRHPAPDHSPAWSPDGSWIAFLRRTGAATVAVFIIPALGGPERRIAELSASPWSRWSRPGPLLSWSPNGKWLVAAGYHKPGENDRLIRISVTTGELQDLTLPPSGTMGDAAVAISPDGRTVAFSRLMSWGRLDLYLLDVSRDMLPMGEIRRIETGTTWNASPSWHPDGNSLIFSSGTMDKPHLTRIARSDSGRAERMAGTDDYGWQPSLARQTNRDVCLVYAQHFESVNIWRSSLDGKNPAVRIIASSHWSYEPAYTLDGTQIAFLSDRSGNDEIWTAGSDGMGLQQWTFLKQARLGSPRWSPDGKRIAFTVPDSDGASSIYIVDAPGATPRLIPGSHRCGYFAWSPDGSALYFTSNRASSYDIWKIAAGGGEAVQVTRQRGRVPTVSSDGRFLFYLKLASSAGDSSLYRMPVAGGKEVKILDYVDTYCLNDFGIAFKHYRPGLEPEGPELRFLSFSTGKIEPVFGCSSKLLRYGIAASSDGRHLLYSQADYQISDLMIVHDVR